MKTLYRAGLPLILLGLLLGGCSDDKPTISLDPPECPYIGPGDFVPVETIAEMTHYEIPEYPPEAEQAGIEGTVWIKAKIGTSGNVLEAQVAKSSGVPSLDQAALAAAYYCDFNPALMNGQPVCMWVTWKVEFELEP
jgi:TonB family protein